MISGIDRKRFLAGLLGLPAWIAAGRYGMTPGAVGAAEPPQAESGGAPADARSRPAPAESVEQRVERVLREYDAQGIHRTGTDVDSACARWLAEEARRLGAESALEAMPVDRIDVRECYAEIAGQRIEGVPLFDCGVTGPEGLPGKLMPAAHGERTEVGFWLDTMPDAAGGKEFLEHRRSSQQRGLIAVTGGPRWNLDPGLALLNAESYEAPFGAPVVQVSSEARALVESAAGSEVRIMSHIERKRVEAFNTIASVRGKEASLPPLVVMTPRSGWWQCAAERGGGIAVWVEIVAAVAATRPPRTVHFVASTGHELGHYGLEYYLRSRQDQIRGARAWIHLGANFTAAIRPKFRVQFSDQELRTLSLDALARRGLVPDAETALGERPIGEARNVADGGRYLSILGFSGRFHQPSDRFPEAVDVPKAIAFAKAYVEIALALASA